MPKIERDPQRSAIERLMASIDHRDGPQFLLEHLAEWGSEGLDVQDLAGRVLNRDEE